MILEAVRAAGMAAHAASGLAVSSKCFPDIARAMRTAEAMSRLAVAQLLAVKLPSNVSPPAVEVKKTKKRRRRRKKNAPSGEVVDPEKPPVPAGDLGGPSACPGEMQVDQESFVVGVVASPVAGSSSCPSLLAKDAEGRELRAIEPSAVAVASSVVGSSTAVVSKPSVANPASSEALGVASSSRRRGRRKKVAEKEAANPYSSMPTEEIVRRLRANGIDLPNLPRDF